MQALHCATSSSCFFTITLAGLDYMPSTGLPPPHASSPLPWLALTTCLALDYLRIMLLRHYPGWPRLHASTALHYLRLMLLHHYPGWHRLHASTALHCTALHCTTSASCFFTITLAGLDYMQVLHCIALPPPHVSSPLPWLA
jgi:hypothetical protein